MHIRTIRSHELGTLRLMAHLSAMERLSRESRCNGLTRLETALGARIALRALAVARTGQVPC